MARDIGLQRLKHYWKLYFFVLPSVLLVAMFAYYPAVSALYHSFFRWNGEDIKIWVGDGNFRRVMGNYWVWLATLAPFLAVLYMAKEKSDRGDRVRQVGGILSLLIAAGVMGVKGLAFDPRVLTATADGAMLLNLGKAGGFLGYGLLVWGLVLLCLHALVSTENGKRWFYLSIPVCFMAVAFLQAFGFAAVFAWMLVTLAYGLLLWIPAAAERLPEVEGARTAQSFMALSLCIWALGAHAGGDPQLWGGFTIIAILVAFNIVKMLPSILTAVVIHRLKSDACNYWYRVLFVVPMIIPGMVGLLLWKFFFNPQEGLFNRILVYSKVMDLLALTDRLLGWGGIFRAGQMPVWLGHEHLVLPAMIIWGFPWVGVVGVLIYLAGLQGIDTSVYEAADLDGAGPVQKFFHIELPLILTQVRINMVLMIIGTLQSYAFILILFGIDGGPNGKLMVPGLYMFRTAFRESFAGYACAIGLVLFAFILILTEINNKYIRVEK